MFIFLLFCHRSCVVSWGASLYFFSELGVCGAVQMVNLEIGCCCFLMQLSPAPTQRITGKLAEILALLQHGVLRRWDGGVLLLLLINLSS